jgi:hypothetical protein
MKSFLQEIEDKFIEIEEAVNVSAKQLNDPEIQKLVKDPNAEVNITEIEEDHICERDHPGMTHEEYEEKELEEMSTTAAVAPITGKYFLKGKKKRKKDPTYESVQNAMDNKYERLIESYRKFSLGEKNKTPKQTVERTIQQVSKKLKEIETLVEYTKKLKTESGMSRDNYGPRTEKALNKISKKLIKIAERVRAIGE